MSLTEQLGNLALAAQESPPKSGERQRFLEEMFKLIEENNLLTKPPKNNLSNQQYRLLYEDAKSKTFLDICRNIHRFDASQSRVMSWINNCYMRHNFQVVLAEFNRDKLRHQNLDDSYNSLKKLLRHENLLHHDRSTLDQREEIVRNFLQEDPEGLLSNAHIRGLPEITLQQLLLMKYVEDLTLETMSQRLSVSISTIDSFIKRQLKSQRIRDYFDKYLGDN